MVPGFRCPVRMASRNDAATRKRRDPVPGLETARAVSVSAAFEGMQVILISVGR